MESDLRRFDTTVPVEEAAGIPSTWYTDARILALESKAVFNQTWQYVGPADAVAQPGDYLSGVIGGEPLVVVRGDDGTLRAMSNVCRHRGGPLVQTERGHCSVLRCAYHGWTYGLDGQLRGTPDFDGVRNFDRSAMRLPQVQVATLGPFVFACNEAGVPTPASLAAHLAQRDLQQLHFVQRKTYEVRCNWKVYVDNYLDGGYHIPHIHPALMTAIEYNRYVCELHDGWNVQIAPLRRSSEPQVAAVRAGETAYYYWAWPNFMVNWYDGVMDINHVIPLAIDRTAVVFDFYFADQDRSAMDSSIRVTDQVQEEDRVICETVQNSLSSRWYDRGRYSVRRENGGHQFHRMLAESLQKAARSDSELNHTTVQ